MAFKGQTKTTGSITAEQLFAAMRAAISNRNPNDSLLQILASAALPQVLIIESEDSLRSQRLIHWLNEKLLKIFAQSSVSTLFSFQVDTASLLESTLRELLTPSLFSQTGMIVLHDIDSMKVTSLKPLAECLNRLPEDKLVILTASSLDSRKTFLKDTGKNALVVSIPPLGKDKLVTWTAREAKELIGESATVEAIHELISLVGEKPAHIYSELLKLSLMLREGEKLSADKVRSCVQRSAEHSSFELIEAMSRKDAVGAGQLASDLVEQGQHPLQVLAFLSKAFQTMIVARESRRQENIHPQLTRYGFVKGLASATSQFSLPALNHAMRVLKSLDERLKSSSLHEKEEFIAAVIAITLRRGYS
ncbi:MAG: DNA polymerase III subunit delta [bacterium]|nr:DNA polymerase III subunit delta [bacterium]